MIHHIECLGCTSFDCFRFQDGCEFGVRLVASQYHEMNEGCASEWRTIHYPANWAIWDEGVFPILVGWWCAMIFRIVEYKKGMSEIILRMGWVPTPMVLVHKISIFVIIFIRVWRLDPLLRSYMVTTVQKIQFPLNKVASGRYSCWCSGPLRCVLAWMMWWFLGRYVGQLSSDQNPHYLLYIGDFTTQLFRYCNISHF